MWQWISLARLHTQWLLSYAHGSRTPRTKAKEIKILSNAPPHVSLAASSLPSEVCESGRARGSDSSTDLLSITAVKLRNEPRLLYLLPVAAAAVQGRRQDVGGHKAWLDTRHFEVKFQHTEEINSKGFLSTCCSPFSVLLRSVIFNVPTATCCLSNIIVRFSARPSSPVPRRPCAGRAAPVSSCLHASIVASSPQQTPCLLTHPSLHAHSLPSLLAALRPTGQQ